MRRSVARGRGEDGMEAENERNKEKAEEQEGGRERERERRKESGELFHVRESPRRGERRRQTGTERCI